MALQGHTVSLDMSLLLKAPQSPDHPRLHPVPHAPWHAHLGPVLDTRLPVPRVGCHVTSQPSLSHLCNGAIRPLPWVAAGSEWGRAPGRDQVMPPPCYSRGNARSKKQCEQRPGRSQRLRALRQGRGVSWRGGGAALSARAGQWHPCPVSPGSALSWWGLLPPPAPDGRPGHAAPRQWPWPPGWLTRCSGPIVSPACPLPAPWTGAFPSESPSGRPSGEAPPCACASASALLLAHKARSRPGRATRTRSLPAADLGFRVAPARHVCQATSGPTCSRRV